MNLVLSGEIEHELTSAVEELVRPSTVEYLHSRAVRFTQVQRSSAAEAIVAALCSQACVDFAFLKPGARLSDFKMMVMDMDSTLISIECIDELAAVIGHRATVAAITESAMRGEIDFAESLRQRTSLLAGGPIELLCYVYSERLRLNPGATELLEAAARCGIYRLLLSGGFRYFADALKALLNFDAAYANELEIIDNYLTGRLLGQIVDAEAKADHVRRLKLCLNASAEQVIVIGDGANDIPMMNESSASIAYHAKPVVRTAARISITHGSLGTVLDFFPT